MKVMSVVKCISGAGVALLLQGCPTDTVDPSTVTDPDTVRPDAAIISYRFDPVNSSGISSDDIDGDIEFAHFEHIGGAQYQGSVYLKVPATPTINVVTGTLNGITAASVIINAGQEYVADWVIDFEADTITATNATCIELLALSTSCNIDGTFGSEVGEGEYVADGLSRFISGTIPIVTKEWETGLVTVYFDHSEPALGTNYQPRHIFSVSFDVPPEYTGAE
ncbi:hypothetical protein OAV62_00440 [bacterium]|nr:hypothetical protein [bacterium]